MTVEDELENVKSYMEIQQIRNENLFRYEIECGEELKTRVDIKADLTANCGKCSQNMDL